MLGEPPDVVPKDLTAEEFLELGIWYRESKKIEQARQCLEKARALAPDSDISSRGRLELDEHIPRYENSSEIVDKFNQGSLTAIGSPAKAQKLYQELIDSNPEFEWPYRALAESLLRQKGDVEQARILMSQALEINPEYTAGLVTMAELELADMEYGRAGECLDRALRLVPDNVAARNLQRSLEILVSLDSE